MVRVKKKGEAGAAKNYITRTQAVKKLQISLPDFRRLCIFKGIYPREPRSIKKANRSATHSTTFYYTKDIQYLLHEPLLGKFREQKALSKKIARSLGRNEIQDAVRLEKYGMPKIKLDHIVRERYPTFVDALRDLDDALSLLFLFANLPSTSTVPTKTISRCQRLCHEFEHYLIATNSLRKSFLSIKGIYYQATIQGEDIMWLVPYRFVQRVTQDVDYRIMGTFVEFYCTLLGFVNYRLYTSIGLVYPPKFDSTSDEKGAELAAFTLEGKDIRGVIEGSETVQAITNGNAHTENSVEVQTQLDKVVQSDLDVQDQIAQELKDAVEEESQAIDKFEVAAPEGDQLDQPSVDPSRTAQLFSDLTVFISREAPRHSIEFLLRSFGCRRVAWDQVLGEGAFTHDEKDTRITHQIVDRPPTTVLPESANDEIEGNETRVRPGHIVPGRIYVQPQWIWDCANEGKLLRPDLYAPGASLPPHLSPWIKPTEGQYDPRATLEEQELEGEAEDAAIEGQTKVMPIAEDDDAISADEDDDSIDDEVEDEIDAHGMDIATLSDSDDESISQHSDEDGFKGFDAPTTDATDLSSDHSDAEDDGAKHASTSHQAELEAEALGLPITATNDTITTTKTLNNPKTAKKQQTPAQRQRAQARQADKEEIERRKVMMSNKKRKLYEKMTFSNDRRDEESSKLRAKRRRIEMEREMDRIE